MMMGVHDLKRLFFGGLCLSLSSCEESQNLGREVKHLEVEVAELELKVEELDAGFQEVMAALFKLGAEVEDFRSENWQVNVPDVEFCFEELKRVASEVEKKF